MEFIIDRQKSEQLKEVSNPVRSTAHKQLDFSVYQLYSMASTNSNASFAKKPSPVVHVEAQLSIPRSIFDENELRIAFLIN